MLATAWSRCALVEGWEQRGSSSGFLHKQIWRLCSLPTTSVRAGRSSTGTLACVGFVTVLRFVSFLRLAKSHSQQWLCYFRAFFTEMTCSLPEQQVRAVSQPRTHYRSHYHVTYKMHPKNDARHGDAHRQGEQGRLQLRIEDAQGDGNSEGAHRVARRERKLVRWKDFRPAMGFELARALPLAGFFDKAEQYDGCCFGRRTGGESDEPHVAPEQKQRDPHGIPDPAISEARGSYHPKAEPSRRAPVMDLPHDLIVAGLYKVPDHSSSRHDCTSFLP